jgi:hypothetical protein
LFIPTLHHFLGSFFCRSFGARCNPFGPIEYYHQSPLHEILVKQTAPSHVTMIRDKDIIPRDTVYLTPCQVGGFKGHEGAVESTAKRVENETGVRPSDEEVASLLGKSGHKRSVKTTADCVENETGVRLSDEEAASLQGK